MSAATWVGGEGEVPGLDRVQPFAPLDAATEAALRASIERFGVIVPVVKDQHGRILDGHHRDRIAGELGKTYEEKVFLIGDENDAREVARTLNADRRQLSADQRRPMVAALYATGEHSQPAIAGALGVSPKTVWNDIQAEQLATGRKLVDRVKGLDGKSRPATRPAREPAAPEWRTRQGLYNRTDKTAPFEAKSNKAKVNAAAQARRLTDGLAHVGGVCHGIHDIDFGMVAASLTVLELRSWATKAGEAAKTLRDVRNHLLEVSDARKAH